jgi:hypothetical protein
MNLVKNRNLTRRSCRRRRWRAAAAELRRWVANMMRNQQIKSLCLTSALAFLFCAVLGNPASAQEISPADRTELLKVVTELREAILLENINGILKHLRPGHGLTCTDTLIPYKQVKSDLQNKNSHLYMSLFDSKTWREQCGNHYPPEYPAISEKEFFSKVTDDPVEITPLKDSWAKVTFKPKNTSLYPREWYFHKEDGAWKFGDGFIISRCSCG